MLACTRICSFLDVIKNSSLQSSRFLNKASSKKGYYQFYHLKIPHMCNSIRITIKNKAVWPTSFQCAVNFTFASVPVCGKGYEENLQNKIEVKVHNVFEIFHVFEKWKAFFLFRCFSSLLFCILKDIIPKIKRVDDRLSSLSKIFNDK